MNEKFKDFTPESVKNLALYHLDGAIDFYKKEYYKEDYRNVSFSSVIRTLSRLKTAIKSDVETLELKSLRSRLSIAKADDARRQSLESFKNRDKLKLDMERQIVEVMINSATSEGKTNIHVTTLSDEIRQELTTLGYIIIRIGLNRYLVSWS